MWPGPRERRRGGGGEERWIETEAGAKRGGNPEREGDERCEWRTRSSADDETGEVWELRVFITESGDVVSTRQGREGAGGGGRCQELLSFRRTVTENFQMIQGFIFDRNTSLISKTFQGGSSGVGVIEARKHVSYDGSTVFLLDHRHINELL